jgi:adenylate kinase family enzyme
MTAIASIHAVVVLTCSSESVFCRIAENTGGDRAGRKDDEHALIDKKLKLFSARTAPLIEYYERSGCRIYRIDINARTTAVSAYHHLSSLAAAYPPVTLIAEPPERRVGF